MNTGSRAVFSIPIARSTLQPSLANYSQCRSSFSARSRFTDVGGDWLRFHTQPCPYDRVQPLLPHATGRFRPLADAHFLSRLWVLGGIAMENSTCPDRCDRRRTRLTHDRFKFAGRVIGMKVSG